MRYSSNFVKRFGISLRNYSSKLVNVLGTSIRYYFCNGSKIFGLGSSYFLGNQQEKIFDGQHKSFLPFVQIEVEYSPPCTQCRNIVLQNALTRAAVGSRTLILTKYKRHNHCYEVYGSN